MSGLNTGDRRIVKLDRPGVSTTNRATSAVNVFGKIQDAPEDLAAVPDGATIRIERLAP